VGKTSLVVRWAHQATATLPDAQLHVNLRGYGPSQPSVRRGNAGWLLVTLDNAATVEQVPAAAAGRGDGDGRGDQTRLAVGAGGPDGARRADLDLLPVTDAVAPLRLLIGERVDADPAAAQTLAVQRVLLVLSLLAARCRRPAVPPAGPAPGPDWNRHTCRSPDRGWQDARHTVLVMAPLHSSACRINGSRRK
jgi:hypothetical protein